MRRRLAFLAGLGAFALIGGAALSQSDLSAPSVQPTVPTPDQPGPLAPPPGPISSSTCEAPSLTWLIGKPRTDIPVPVQPAARRVYCSTCMVTQDYQPSRTDIVFDAQTGLVTQVKCG